MLIVLLITALFVVISVFLFFRAEKLQRNILLLKRENSNIQTENDTLSKSMILVSSNYEIFAKQRLQELTKAENSNISDIEVIKPLINNYSVIFRECLKGKGRFQSITKKCFKNQDKEIFRLFISQIQSDTQTKRLWSSNNLSGFIGLVDNLLAKHESKEVRLMATAS